VKLVIERVSRAEVRVEGKVVGRIGRGLLVLFGAEKGDGAPQAEEAARRLAGLRVFPDAEGRMNLALADVAGSVLAVSQFTLAADLSRGRRPGFERAMPPAEAEPPDGGPDLAQVKGQEVAKRALEIAAAGGHNLLMSGPPGAGKSLLAACLPGILPPLQPSEALEVSMVASVAGELNGGRIRRQRPFRAPHHSASMPALVGGGLRVRPGEISLAHLGILFLDELPEFHGIR